MPQDKKEVKINFGIRKISVIDSSIETSKYKTDNKNPEFTFNFELGFRFDQKTKEISFLLSFIVTPEKKPNLVVGKMKIEIMFFIKNMDDFLHPKEPKINLPDQFMSNLIGIVISTSRGLWASKVMGTKLENAILPILHPNEFLKGLKSRTKSGA